MKNIQIYQSKYNRLSGTSHSDIMKTAWRVFDEIQSKNPRRQPFVRTKKKSFLGGQKVFIKPYFAHLKQKELSDRIRRVRLLLAGLDLIRNTTYLPEIKNSTTKKGDQLLRFKGCTADGIIFCVQIQKNKRGNHNLMSTFECK